MPTETDYRIAIAKLVGTLEGLHSVFKTQLGFALSCADDAIEEGRRVGEIGQPWRADTNALADHEPKALTLSGKED